MASSQFVTCLSNGTSFLAVRCPLQKSIGVTILVSIPECRFFLHITVHRQCHRSKLDFNSSNGIGVES